MQHATAPPAGSYPSSVPRHRSQCGVRPVCGLGRRLNLGPIAQRGEIAHPVKIKDTVQVIDLMLQDTRLEACGLTFDSRAVRQPTAVTDARMTRHDAPKLRHRQATLPA